MNAEKARALVSGKFKRPPGRPKKPADEKEKPRTIRASDNFIARAKELAGKQGFKGAWQTWLKDLARKQFQNSEHKG